MAFTNLGTHEKQAFFDLLDEYFASRPELLSSLGGSASSESATNGADVRTAATSAVRNALASNPEATANLVSSGLRHGAGHSSVKNSPFASAASNPAIANSVGRVAAASLAFQNRNQSTSPPAPTPARSTPPPPPAPRNAPPAFPRRTSSSDQQQHEQEEESTSVPPPPGRPPIAKKGSGASGLLSSRTFGGDVDTTSFKSGFLSVKNANTNKAKGPPSVAPPVPPAFPKRQHDFAPPPQRRLTSDSSPPAHAPPPPARGRTPTPEPEEEPGEWAEALYDYNSGEAGDLVLQEKQRVKIVSRDTDDWWTGEINGRTGLFPASYVRAL